MEKIINQLQEIVKEQLKDCKEKKEVPSKDLLDTISTLNIIIHSC